MKLFANDTFIVPDDPGISGIPPGFEPESFGLQFIPLLVVRINRTDTLLMKPGESGWSGCNVENVRVTSPPSMGLSAFLAARDAALGVLRGARDEAFAAWAPRLDAAVAGAFPGSGFSIGKLVGDVLRNFGMEASRADGAVTLAPFAEPPHALYVAPDDATGLRVLYAAIFLRLVVDADDHDFLEYRNLEYVPLRFFVPGLRLHPRYALHTATLAFFGRYGFPTGSPPGSPSVTPADEIPVLEWKMRRRVADSITFACDLSFYYDNVGDPDIFERGFFPPNPESREERFLADMKALGSEGLRPEIHRLRALALLDEYAIEAIVRSGMFIRSYSPGRFAGFAETADFDDGEGRVSAAPLHAFSDLARFLKRVRIVLDRKRIETVGPLYDDPERWFNLRRDVVPFDAELEFARAASLLDRAPVPSAAGAVETGYRKHGLVVTGEACRFFPLELFLSLPDGRDADRIEPGTLYFASRDDALGGFRARDADRDGQDDNFYIWRMT
ncbi:MAG: hypothetical protein NT080_09760 [Spirochaetes bacterium]|nr:hypothetical protein [Spirochaetota bacterium]